MVKGISKQVIVVHAPEPQLFEQAIFILREDVVKSEGVTEEALLKEANRIIGLRQNKRSSLVVPATVWAAAGAFAIVLVWLMSSVF